MTDNIKETLVQQTLEAKTETEFKTIERRVDTLLKVEAAFPEDK